MNYLDEYVKKYDLTNPKLKYKYHHSYRVMENMCLLAKNMNLSYQDINLAKCIGILHDIGRFEQYQRLECFNDELLDHGDYAVSLLEKEKILLNFNISKEDYHIIYTAIKNHNKYKIEDNLTKRELLFAKMIRDADKLDILYALSNPEIKPKIYEDDGKISKEIKNSFYKEISASKDYIHNANDNIVLLFSFVYDINFYITKYLIKKKDYYGKIYNRLKNKDIFKEYYEYTNNYLKERTE